MIGPNRATPPSPYDYLAAVPSFTVTSTDITDGKAIDRRFVADANFGLDGDNVSPQLHWEGFPAETRSFAVTCFDPDAPTGSGFWHWVLFDIPAGVNELATGAASGDLTGVPAGAIHARNDTGNALYVGPFPPAGHGPHRYVFAVHALDVEQLGPDASAPPAVIGFNASAHVLARAVLTATFEVTG
ncbi:MAG: YbhB/YbcL family Raf kinase inhibitor-like protein [Microthrixaceae bacterium]